MKAVRKDEKVATDKAVHFIDCDGPDEVDSGGDEVPFMG
jgi:hypothetical protein